MSINTFMMLFNKKVQELKEEYSDDKWASTLKSKWNDVIQSLPVYVSPNNKMPVVTFLEKPDKESEQHKILAINVNGEAVGRAKVRKGEQDVPISHEFLVKVQIDKQLWRIIKEVELDIEQWRKYEYSKKILDNFWPYFSVEQENIGEKGYKLSIIFNYYFEDFKEILTEIFILKEIGDILMNGDPKQPNQ